MRYPSPILAGLCAMAVACTDVSRSPLGDDLIPGGVLEGDLEIIVIDEWSFVADYEVFPSARAEADRIVAALDWGQSPGFESRPIFTISLAAFDSIPEGSEILSTNLKLVYGSPPEVPVTLSVHRVTSEWNEQAATWERRDFGVPWDQPGGDFDPEPELEFTIEPGEGMNGDTLAAGRPDSVTVAFPMALLDDWRSGAVPNHGLIIVQQTPGAGIEFVSRGDSGFNSNGPRVQIEVQLGEPGSPASLLDLDAIEDSFLAIDRAPPDGANGLRSVAGAPVLRSVLVPTVDQVPPGVTVAEAKLIVSVEAARVPSDSLRFVAREVFGEFRGEKTVLAPLTGNTILGLATLYRDSLPADSLVFESLRLRTLVRRWLEDPETITGIAITVLEEESSFGGMSFFDPGADVVLRPRIRLVVLPLSSSARP